MALHTNYKESKLNPRWEGGWTSQEIHSLVNAKISDGQCIRLVHFNRICHRAIPQEADLSCAPTNTNDTYTWQPPQIDHMIVSEDPPEQIQRYPQRERWPPNRYIP